MTRPGRGAVQGATDAGDVDVFAFELAAGQSASAAVDGPGAAVELLDAAGGPAGPDFVAPADGTYFARVTGTGPADYTVVVTRDAAFNQDPDTPPSLDRDRTAFGFVEETPAVSGVFANADITNLLRFDVPENLITDFVPIEPQSQFLGDVAVLAEEQLAFVTDFNGQVWVVDLDGDLSPADGVNPIPISAPGLDLSLTPGGQYLIVSSDTGPAALSVIDVATRTEVTAFEPGVEHVAVEAGAGGSVVTASFTDSLVRLLTLDAAGGLADTGDSFTFAEPGNVVLAPDGRTGVVVGRDGGGAVTSFVTDGLTPVDTRSTSRSFGDFAFAAAFSPDGTRLYVRTNDFTFNPTTVDVFAYDPATGELSADPILTYAEVPSPPSVFFGVDPISLTPDGSTLYVSQSGVVSYDALTGEPTGGVQGGGAFGATGLEVYPVPEDANADEYTFTAAAGEAVTAYAGVPAAGRGAFANGLSPTVVVFDSDGEPVARAEGNAFAGTGAAASFVPDADGTYTVRVFGADGTGGEYVVSLNFGPAVAGESFDTVAGTPISGSVAANDTDPEGDELTYSVVTGPATGSLTLEPDGTFTYIPPADFDGTVTFTYEATDGFNAVQGTATINVAAVDEGTPGVELVGDVLVVVGTDGFDSVRLFPVNGDPTGVRYEVFFSGVGQFRGQVTGARAARVVTLGAYDQIEMQGGLDIPAAVTDTGGGTLVRLGRGDNLVTLGDGFDNVTTFGGDDTISVGGGGSVIKAGDGDNVITAEAGYDNVEAGDGDDAISVGGGGSVIRAGDGDNLVTTGEGYDNITAGGGADRVAVGGGGSIVRSGGGNDTLIGGGGRDQFAAGSGDDILLGGAGNDLLEGDAGVDVIAGGVGGDFIRGGPGDDRLIDGDVSSSDGDLDALLGLLAGLAVDPDATDGLTLSTDADRDSLSGDAGSDVIWAGGIDALFTDPDDDVRLL